MTGYCKHLVPLYHSCENCNNDEVEKTRHNVRISQLENQLNACRALVKAQEKQIIELATKLTYANQTIENFHVEAPKEKEYYDEDTFDIQYLYVYNDTKNGVMRFISKKMIDLIDWEYMGKVRLEK